MPTGVTSTGQLTYGNHATPANPRIPVGNPSSVAYKAGSLAAGLFMPAEEAGSAGLEITEDAGTGLANTAKTCVGGESFTAGTPVLLATGKTLPISQLKPGDKVLATTPRPARTSRNRHRRPGPPRHRPLQPHHQDQPRHPGHPHHPQPPLLGPLSALRLDSGEPPKTGKHLKTPTASPPSRSAARVPAATTAGCGTSPSPATTTTTSMWPSAPQRISSSSNRSRPTADGGKYGQLRPAGAGQPDQSHAAGCGDSAYKV